MNVEQKLELFGYLHRISGALAIVFLVLTIILFWKLGIWQILLERTGIARKKSISQMQQVNAKSSRLTRSSGAQIAAQEFTSQLTEDRKKERKNKRTGEMKNGEKTRGSERPARPESKVPPEYAGRFVLTVNQQIIHTDEQIGEVEV